MANAQASFRKVLFSNKPGGALPFLNKPMSDLREAELVCRRIEELLQTHPPSEIAVLFRAGFHSYPLENELRKAKIPFRKYGGLKFTEAAHIKDVFAFARLAINPFDQVAFTRIALMHPGIGHKTVETLQEALRLHDVKPFQRFPELMQDLNLLDSMRNDMPKPSVFFANILVQYRPRMEHLYSDDWPSRLQGLEEILNLADVYDSLDIFMADMALENPDKDDDANAENCITLSTVHSAKGLEWNSVIILDAVEDRFPSRHAQTRVADFEEERRLFYVACTRAKENLAIYAPSTVYSYNGSNMVAISPFLRELPDSLFQGDVESAKSARNFSSTVIPTNVDTPITSYNTTRNTAPITISVSPVQSSKSSKSSKVEAEPEPLSGYCRHKIFGRGRVVKDLGEGRIQVDFPGFGLKVILAAYLQPEE